MVGWEYGTRQFPRCEQRRYACVKCIDGRCMILHDTHFRRPCPFYKSRAMINAQKKGDKRE